MSAINVQFSVALHLMTAIAYNPTRGVTSSELAESVNTNASFVRKSLSKLVKGGLIIATRGKNGAYALAMPPQAITLLDIYRVSEAPPAFAIHGYEVERECPVSTNIKPCAHGILKEVQQTFEETLSKRTLADLVVEVRA